MACQPIEIALDTLAQRVCNQAKKESTNVFGYVDFVPMLLEHKRSETSKRCAAEAIEYLVDGKVHPDATPEEYRDALFAAGVVPLLVAMLSAESDAPSGIIFALYALNSLAAKGTDEQKDAMVEAGVFSALVPVPPQGAVTDLQQRSCDSALLKILRNLVSGSAERKNALVKAGGIEAIAPALNGEVNATACGVLDILVRDPDEEGRRLIVEKAELIIPPLVAQMEDGAQTHPNSIEKANPLMVVTTLARYYANLRQPLVDAGVIQPLVRLLASANNNPEQTAEANLAADALGYLAHKSSLIPAIVEAGAIEPLVALIMKQYPPLLQIRKKAAKTLLKLINGGATDNRLRADILAGARERKVSFADLPDLRDWLAPFAKQRLETAIGGTDLDELRVAIEEAELVSAGRARIGAVLNAGRARIAAIEEAERVARREVFESIGLGGVLPECPITCEFMKDPVVASDGHTYEREAIQGVIDRALQNGSEPTSPLTRETITSELRPNIELRKMVETAEAKAKAAKAEADAKAKAMSAAEARAAAAEAAMVKLREQLRCRSIHSQYLQAAAAGTSASTTNANGKRERDDENEGGDEDIFPWTICA